MAKLSRLNLRAHLSMIIAAATSALPGTAMAESTPAPADTPAVAVNPADEEEIVVYYHGSIKDRHGAKAVENPLDAKLPALPIVYEEGPATPVPVTSAA